MRADRPAAPLHATRGVSLLEVLIALVVLSIGLLGLAGLQNVSLQRNQSAYYRTVATLLAYDIADRMRANRASLGDYVISATSTHSAPTDCTAAVCTPSNLADFDLSQWLAELTAKLPNGKGAIVDNGGGLYTIQVMWDDTRQGLTGTTCSGAATDMKCFKLMVRP